MSTALARVLASPILTESARLLTRGRLRILTYHRVPDPSRFAEQLDLLATSFVSVTGAEAADAWAARTSLPPEAVWITFDDGDISVIERALPLLDERRLKATAFLCGGLIGSTDMTWWEVLDAALSNGLIETSDLGTTDPATLRRILKGAPDQRRREVIELWRQRGRAAGHPMTMAQWSEGDVGRWLASGHEVGNHTWDHPCIDRCDPAEQERQIVMSHERLTAIAGAEPRVFAWPNGNASAPALTALRRLDYRLVLECDHRLTRRQPDPMAVSRLKLDSDVGLDRTKAIVSGVHSTLFHFSRRFPSRSSHGSNH